MSKELIVTDYNTANVARVVWELLVAPGKTQIVSCCLLGFNGMGVDLLPVIWESSMNDTQAVESISWNLGLAISAARLTLEYVKEHAIILTNVDYTRELEELAD